MKHNIIKVIGSLIVGLTLLTSCNEFLDKTPDNRTEIDSVEKVAQLVAGSYPRASYAAMLEARCDNITDKGIGQENNTNTFAFYWRDLLETSQDTPDYFWQRCYYSIAGVNHAIEAAELLDAADQERVSPYIAEAHIVRAFSHFLIATTFSKYFDTENQNTNPGIPYVTEPETVVIKQYERGTVKSIKENIEKDLTKGLSMLGTDAVYEVPRYHFNYKAAHAFASRFYLYNGEWEKVIQHSSNIIPIPSELMENGNIASTDAANVYADNNFQPWTSTYLTVPSSNDIKAFYTDGSNPSNLLLTEMSSRLSRYANTWRYGVDGALRDEIFKATPTGSKFGYRIYSSSSTHYYVPKFREHFVRTSINATTGTIYTIFPYFRNEEVLLNRAEAYAMLGQYQNAINDLNVFARKLTSSYDEDSHVLTETKILNHYKGAIANAEYFINKYGAYDSASWEDIKKAIILCIIDFRNQEFKWEGLRYYDMIRYKIPSVHTNHAGVTNTLYPGDDRWTLQIPETAKLSGVELNPRTNLLSPEW